MKNLKIVFTLALIAAFCMPLTAQKSVRKAKKALVSTVSKMDSDQKKKVMDYAKSLGEGKAKKNLARTYKKLSVENRQKLTAYVSKLNAPKIGNPVVAAPKSKVKTPKVKTPAPKSRVNMKDGVAKAKKSKVKAAAPTGPLTKVEVLEASYNFGVITQGEKAQHVYKIKNIGKNPLIISRAKGSCGCTVPKWPKAPIAPGEIAEIDVVFNSRGKRGKQNKRITITANTDPVSTILTIKGEVKMPEGGVKKPAKPPVKQ